MFWMVNIFLLLATMGGVVAAGDLDDATGYYSWIFGNFTDISGFNYHASNSGSTNTSGILDSARDFDGADDGVNIMCETFNQTDEQMSISVWFKYDTLGTPPAHDRIIGHNYPGGERFYVGLFSTRGGAEPELWYRVGDMSDTFSDTTDLNTSQWYHVVVTVNDTKVNFYLDGVLDHSETSITSFTPCDGGKFYCVGTDGASPSGCFASSDDMDGQIDELGIYPFPLTAEQVTELNNGGLAFNPYTAGPPPSVDFSVSALDIGGSTINNFSATVNGTEYATTNGVLETNITIGSGDVDIVLHSAIDSNGAFFNKTFSSVTTNSNFEATGLYQAEIDFQAFEIFTNNSVDGVFKFDNGTIVPNFMLAGLFNFTFVNSSYYDKTIEYQLNALFNDTILITGVFNAIINIKAVNAFTNVSIINFSGNVSSYDANWTDTYITIDGNAEIEVLQGNWSVFIEALGFATNDDINFQNLSISPGTIEKNHTFGLYTNNSILFNIFNAETLGLITEQVNISMTTINQSYSFNTSNGVIFAQQINDGTYVTIITSTTFTPTQIFITVTNNSFQQQNIFLNVAGEDVTFFVQNNLGEFIEGAIATFKTDVNGSPVVVAQEITDFAGIFQVELDPTKFYAITITHPEYEVWTGTVKPTQEEYTINVDNLGVTQFISIYEDVRFSTRINHPANSTFAEFFLDIFSNIGSLQFYGLSYNSTVFANQTSSTGGGVEFINVTSINPINEVITITYWFKSTNQSLLTTWQQTWIVGDLIPSNISFTGGLFNDTETASPGTKVFFGMIIILALMVLGGLLTATLAGASFAGMAGVGVAAFAGFLPLPISIVTIIILAVILLADAMGGAR